MGYAENEIELGDGTKVTLELGMRVFDLYRGLVGIISTIDENRFNNSTRFSITTKDAETYFTGKEALRIFNGAYLTFETGLQVDGEGVITKI